MLSADHADGTGVEALFKNCPHLQHLNLAGEHHHLHPPLGGVRIRNMVEKLIKGRLLVTEETFLMQKLRAELI